MSEIYDGTYEFVEEKAKSFYEQGDYKAAENCFLLLQQKCEHNAEIDIRWLSELPVCYINIGKFYKSIEKIDASEKYLLKALNTTETLIKEKTAKFTKIGLCNVYYELMSFYIALKRADESAVYYSKLLDLLDQLILESHVSSDLEQAENLCLKKKELINENFKRFSYRTKTDYLETIRQMLIIYSIQINAEKAANILNTMIPLCEKLVEIEPEICTPYLASFYLTAYTFSFNDEFLNQALNYANKYPNNDICKDVIELANGLSSFQ